MQDHFVLMLHVSGRCFHPGDHSHDHCWTPQFCEPVSDSVLGSAFTENISHILRLSSAIATASKTSSWLLLTMWSRASSAELSISTAKSSTFFLCTALYILTLQTIWHSHTNMLCINDYRCCNGEYFTAGSHDTVQGRWEHWQTHTQATSQNDKFEYGNAPKWSTGRGDQCFHVAGSEAYNSPHIYAWVYCFSHFDSELKFEFWAPTTNQEYPIKNSPGHLEQEGWLVFSGIIISGFMSETEMAATWGMPTPIVPENLSESYWMVSQKDSRPTNQAMLPNDLLLDQRTMVIYACI